MVHVGGVEGALYVADSSEATDVERVLAAEVRRLRAIEERARDIARRGTDHGRAVARVILGEDA